MKKLKFILFCFCLVSYAHGQKDSLRTVWENEKNSDSLRFKALQRYFWENHRSQPDSVIKSINYQYKLAKQKNNNKFLVYSLKDLATVYSSKREFEKAASLCKEGIVMAKQFNIPREEAGFYTVEGFIFYNQNKFLAATKAFTSALEIYQEVKYRRGIINMNHNLGAINSNIGNYDLALEYYLDDFWIDKNNYNLHKKYKPLYASNRHNIAEVYFQKKDFNKALIYSKEAVKIGEILEDKFGLINYYQLHSSIYLNLNKVDSANIYLNKSMILSKELGVKSKLTNAELLDAEITFINNKPLALKKATEISNNFTKFTAKKIKEKTYKIMAKCYNELNQYEKSLKMYELSMIYKDSLEIEKNSFAVIRESISNGYKRKIKINKQKADKEKLDLKNSHYMKLTAGLLVSILAITLIILYFISKNKKNIAFRDSLLDEIKDLKKKSNKQSLKDINSYSLDKKKINKQIGRRLNETDWKVLNKLIENPLITNKQMAINIFMSNDGIGSSLRRMYEYFEIQDTKYKKIALLREAVKISND